MTRLRWLPVALVLIIAAATLAAPVMAQPLPDRRNLSGRLLSPAGKPLTGATVTLRRASENVVAAYWGGSAVTGADGHFLLERVEDGEYYLATEAPGYAPREMPLTIGPETQALEITLEQLVNLQLRLLDSSGKSMPETRVSLRLQGQGVAGQRFPRPQTDREGRLTIKDLIPGSYLLQAVVPGSGYALIPQIEIGPGGVERAEVRLQPGGTLRVLAREDNPGGTPLGGVQLLTAYRVGEATPPDAGASGQPVLDFSLSTLYSMHLENGGLFTRDGDGRHEISDLPSGTYALRVNLPGYDAPPLQQVSVQTGETTEVIVPLTRRAPHGTVRVRLKTQAGGVPQRRDWDLLFSPLDVSREEGAAVPLPPGGGDPRPVRTGFSRRIRLDDKGEARLYPVPYGRWQVRPALPRSQGAPSPPETVTIEVSEREAGVALTVRPGA